jgi:hypothetical protein
VRFYLSQGKDQVCFLGLETRPIEVTHWEVNHSTMDPPSIRMEREPFRQNPEEEVSNYGDR